MATLRELFVAFRDGFIWLRICYNTFTTLFDDDETLDLLERSASIFFHDLNRVLQEYCYLHACKMTTRDQTGSLFDVR